MCQACFDSIDYEDREPSDLDPHDEPLAEWEIELMDLNSPAALIFEVANPETMRLLREKLTGIPKNEREEKNVNDYEYQPGDRMATVGLKAAKDIADRWLQNENIYAGNGQINKIKLIKFVRENRGEGYDAGYANGLKKGVEESAKYSVPADNYEGPKFHKADYYEMIQYRDAGGSDLGYYYLDSKGTVWVRSF